MSLIRLKLESNVDLLFTNTSSSSEQLERLWFQQPVLYRTMKPCREKLIRACYTP